MSAIDIIVTRDAGDRSGDDIVEPLLGSLPTALSRGRAELDERAQQLQPITLTSIFRAGLRRGQTLRVQDSRRGITWTAKITGISHRCQGGVVTTVLQLERKVIE